MKLKKNTLFVILGLVILTLFGVLIYLLLVGNGDDDVVENDIVKNGEVVFLDDLQDSEGNNYKVVRVGDQVWMGENLKTMHTHGRSWCYSEQDFYCDTYGRLYDWGAVMAGSTEPGSQGICPSGWHVPTDEDWYLLESFFSTGPCEKTRLGWGCYPSAFSLKTSTWGGSEESMFNILAAGFIDRQNKSSLLGSYSYFWTSSSLGDGVWRRGFLESQSNVLRNTENPEFGYSLRCIKD